MSDDHPAVKPPKVARKRKSRAVVKAGNYKLRLGDIRQSAAVDYITDPERRTVKFHYSRDDRSYASTCAITTFAEWAKNDKWVSRRAEFWAEIEQRVLKEYGDQLFQKKMQEIGELSLAQDALLEYITPRIDSTGAIERYPMFDEKGKAHEFGGLPVLPLEMPTADKVAKMIVEIGKLIMVKRGETTSRTENVTIEATGEQRRVTALDPVGAKVAFSKEDIQAMAKTMLIRRQPELAEDYIEVPEEKGIPEDEW